MQVNLVMFKSDGSRRVFPLDRDITLLGRREDCDLRIPLSDVSRKHCRIVKEPDYVRLEDLGSSNGTFCNGVRVQESELSPGDSVTIGPVSFVVQIDGDPADDALEPPVISGEARGSDDSARNIPVDADDSMIPMDDDARTDPSDERRSA